MRILPRGWHRFGWKPSNTSRCRGGCADPVAPARNLGRSEEPTYALSGASSGPRGPITDRLLMSRISRSARSPRAVRSTVAPTARTPGPRSASLSLDRGRFPKIAESLAGRGARARGSPPASRGQAISSSARRNAMKNLAFARSCWRVSAASSCVLLAIASLLAFSADGCRARHREPRPRGHLRRLPDPGRRGDHGQLRRDVRHILHPKRNPGPTSRPASGRPRPSSAGSRR